MKTLAFISHKGGTGKSTLSIHLSVIAEQHGLETLLVDLDSISSTASEWATIREQDKPLVITAQLADVKALSEQAKNEGFDLLILDFPPYFSDDVLQALMMADQVLIPILPGFPELQSLTRYINSIEQDFSLLLNNCQDNEAEDVSKILMEDDLPVSHIHISRQNAFAKALSHGLGVSEYEPDGKPSEQIRAFFQTL